MRIILSIARKAITSTADWLHKPFSRYIPLVTFRYGFTGGLNTAFDILLYFIFYNFILDKNDIDLSFVTISPHIAAFLLVFPITFTSGFLLAKYVTFTQSTLRGRKQLLRYGLTVAGSIVLNYVLLKFFVEICNIWPTFSKILTTLIVVIYSYFAQRYFSFGNAKSSNYSR
jgi:putative flippase GtrA